MKEVNEKEITQEMSELIKKIEEQLKKSRDYPPDQRAIERLKLLDLVIRWNDARYVLKVCVDQSGTYLAK